MKITIDKKELILLIKEAIREVLQEEAINYFLKSIPPVSEEEMNDIKKIYGKPSKKKRVVKSETIDI